MNKKDFSEKALRHGEIGLLPINSLPKGAKLISEVKEFVAGHSESGHNHVLTLPKTIEATIKVFEFEGKTYLDIPLETKLTHQKVGKETHGTVEVKPGLYERTIKRSYSYGSKIMKRVQD